MLHNNKIELLFVIIQLPHRSLIISSVYIPIRSNINIFNDYFDFVEFVYNKHPNLDILLLGDYNLPSACYSNIEVYFNDKLSYFNFVQYNHIFNLKNVILDYVISNSISINVEKNNFPIIPVDPLHPPITITYNYLFSTDLQFNDYVFNWNSGNYSDIINYLGTINWFNYFNSNSNINYDISFLYSHINTAINNFIPKQRRHKLLYPIWFSKELKILIKQKQIAHLAYKTLNLPDSYNNFSNLRTQCKNIRYRDYKLYINNTQNSVKINPKHFWKFYNSQKSSSQLPAVMSYLDKETSSGSEIVNFFKSHFSSVYKPNILNSYNITNFNELDNSLFCLNSINISIMDVFNEFWYINQNQSLGPDGISARFLKETSFILSPIITYLFNKSLTTGIFPDKWKFSFITPIFKKGNKSFVSNYRPISKISIIPKIFSKLVNNKIFPLCENILSNEQHGFRPGRSTITNLSIFKQLILESFNNKTQFDVIYTDFEKAFDRVNHSLLTTKLKAYGFYDPLLSWIHSFLTNRTQAVKYENYISDQINILSGVPQGDHLSPLLFSLFINDINTVLKNSNCLLLADDTKIYKNIKCTNDALQLQYDLNSLYQWCIENDMSLNIDKCAIISFSLKKNTLLFDYKLNNSNLTRTNVIKDLGVFFDTKLSFTFHVNYIRNKSYKKLGFVKRMCKDFYDESALKILYFTLVRSNFDYASLIWRTNNIIQNHSLSTIQNNFLRYLSYKLHYERTPHSGYDITCNLFRIMPLNKRFNILNCKFLYKLLHNIIDCPEIIERLNFRVNQSSSRNNSTFYLSFTSSNYMLYTPANILMSAGNSNKDLDLFYTNLFNLSNI